MTNYTIFDDNTLAEYALVNSISTPCYLYDKNLLDDTFNKVSLTLDKHFKNAFIHYAVKANHNQEIIKYTKI